MQITLDTRYIIIIVHPMEEKIYKIISQTSITIYKQFSPMSFETKPNNTIFFIHVFLSSFLMKHLDAYLFM